MGLEPPKRATCLEYYKTMQGGRTRPMLVGAVDETENYQKIVIKLRHPVSRVEDGHYAGTSLACELVCSMLARAIGLEVPDYYIVQVPPELPACIPDREIRDLLGRNLGENFGSEYKEGMGLWDPTSKKKKPKLIEKLEDVLAFDAAVINGDRIRKKPNLLWRGDQVVLIDHSLALPAFLWGSELIDESPLFPEENVRKHCAFEALNGKKRRYEKMYEIWHSIIDTKELKEIRRSIPPNWEWKEGDLDKVFRFLTGRSEEFANMSANLREVTR